MLVLMFLKIVRLSFKNNYKPQKVFIYENTDNKTKQSFPRVKRK